MKKLKQIDKTCSACGIVVSLLLFEDKEDKYYCGYCLKNNDVVPINGKGKSGIDKFCADCGIILTPDFRNYSDNKNKLYCKNCGSKKFEELVNEEELNKLLDDSINTPPLRLKDLKARLKKKRDEKRKRAE